MEEFEKSIHGLIIRPLPSFTSFGMGEIETQLVEASELLES